MFFGVMELLGLAFYLIFCPLIGAVILRAAVAICNKLLPKPPMEDSPTPDSLENRQDEAEVVQASIQETDNPYATPQAIEVVVPAAFSAAIPEPSYLKAWGICLTAMVVNLASFFVFALFAGSVGTQSSLFVILPWVMLALSLVALTAVLKLMLPTSIARSILVAAAFLFIGFLALMLVGLLVTSIMFQVQT